MLPLKHVVTKHKPKPKFKHKSLSSTSSSSPISLSSIFTNTLHSSKPKPSFSIPDKQIVTTTFKTWFQSSYHSNDPLLLRIHKFLSSENDFSPLFASLNIPLTPSLVIRVIHHVAYNNDFQSCLKFFDWAGHQPRYTHTRATFTAIFRILTRSNKMPMLFDFLTGFMKHEYHHNVRFYDTLVVGYAIAGKPETALHMFGRMRFQGLDLDAFAYHVLLNALGENDYFNSFDVILNQIRIRGYATRVTDTIVVKRLCKKGRLDEVEEYVNGMLGSGKKLRDSEVSMLVGLLCERKKFEHAVELVKEFGNTGLVPLEHAYGVCIKSLVKGGRLDDALEFFRQKRDTEGFVPRLYRYNMLICRLLRENRLHEVYDLLMDMHESCIQPDRVTMNVVLCFFCKIGMVNVALQLYESRSQFGLNPNTIAYKYLILNLCWDGSVKEAYSVFKSFIGNDKDLFPDRQTFTTLANALCRECKVDEMKELMDLAWERREFTLSPVTYAKHILALCQAGRLEDGYDKHVKHNNATAKLYYDKMIEAFIKSNKGEIAAHLLVEMKEKNLRLTRFSCRAVICRLLDMDNPITRVTKLLDLLTQGKPDTKIFNFFIDGAGHANNTDLVGEVYDMMLRNDIVPTLLSQRLVLNSYLRNGKIFYALNFFNSLRRLGVVSKKLYCIMVIGLCKSNKVDIAHNLLFEMLNAGVNPDIECFESLVWKLCSLQRYHKAINLVQVYMKGGRRLTSFLGNTLLWHSSLSPDVYGILVHLRGAKEGENSPISILSFVIGAFSGCLSVNDSIEELEKLIAMCFPLDTHTYNQLLRRVANYDMNQACELFNRMCQRGCKPNGWTYDFMVRGFLNHGRNDEAKQWVEEMHQKGFDLTDSTRINVRKMILSNEE